MKKLFTIAAVLFFAAAGYAAVLFENGKSGYSIVLAPNAAPAEKFAAEELQLILKKSGNVTLPIVNTPGRKGSNIFIRTVSEGTSHMIKDKITVKYDNGDLILQGNKPYCALYAVYRFAEKQLGFRWLYPGNDGEFYTPKKRMVIDEKCSELFIPAILYRYMHICWATEDYESEMWMLRNYGNIGLRSKSLKDKVGHRKYLVAHFGKLTPEMFQTHPEYFSMVNGKRDRIGWAGCWSNEGYMDYFVETVCKSIRENQWETMIIIAADTTVRCECAGCTAEKSVTDRWYNFCRKAFAKIKKQHPDVVLGTSAYHEYLPVPQGNVSYLEAPIDYSFSRRCYVHSLYDKKCPHQAAALAEVEAWRKKCGNISLYCYENDIFIYFAAYIPLMNMLSEQMKYFAAMDPYLVLTEFLHRTVWAKSLKHSFPDARFYRLTNYLFLTLMHTPDQDIKVLMREYCRTLYGPAADLMYKYHTEFADAWDKMDIHLVRYYHNAGTVAPSLLDPELITRFNGYFDTADKLVRSKPEYQRFIKEIELDRINFSIWEKYYNSNSAAAQELPLGAGRDKAVKFTMVNEATFSRTDKRTFKMHTAGSIARDANNLYIHVDCFNKYGEKVKPGTAGKDLKLWTDDHVEVILTTDQQSDYFHFAVNAAGGTYEARMNDVSWNGYWQAETSIGKDRWTADITIPFASLHYDNTPDGRVWSIKVLRSTHDGKDAGFPLPDFNGNVASCKVKFDNEASPEKSVTLIISKKPQADNPAVELINNSWYVRKEMFENARFKKSSGKEVVILTHPGMDEAPLVFYRNRIDSLLDNGGMLIVNDSGWMPFKHIFGEGFPDYIRYKDIEPARKLVWVDSKSTPDELKKWSNLIRYADAYAYTPTPGWHQLAVQKSKKGDYVPVMMYKKHRKGMVVLILGMRHIYKGHMPGFISFLIDRWQQECR